MKHLKYFNDYYNGKFYPGGIDGAHIGDYCILNSETTRFWCDDLLNKIGKITDIDEDAPGNCFKIFFDDFGGKEDQPKYWFFDYELLHYGTLEEIKVYLEAEKYNL